MSAIEEYLYIDYENVQDVRVVAFKKTVKVKIIVGEDQTKVPIDLVQKTQPFGNSVEWIRVNGKGRNALDFLIAFYLGTDVAADGEKSFIIYSKDTGYDPLVYHLNNNGIKARRIVSFQEYSPKKVKIDEAGLNKVKESLTKIAPNKRPKRRSSLTEFIISLLKSLPKKDIDNIIEDLFIRKVVYEENGIMKYSLRK